MNNVSNISFVQFHDTITTQEVISQLSSAFLYQIFMSSLILLALQITCLWYIKDWDLPAWLHMEGQERAVYRKKIFQSMVMLSFVPAMYLTTITGLYLSGVFK